MELARPPAMLAIGGNNNTVVAAILDDGSLVRWSLATNELQELSPRSDHHIIAVAVTGSGSVVMAKLPESWSVHGSTDSAAAEYRDRGTPTTVDSRSWQAAPFEPAEGYSIIHLAADTDTERVLVVAAP